MGTLLYAEDDDNDVFFLQRALRGAGITNPLQVVTDGRQAIAYLRGQGHYADRARFPLPFLMFLDLNLPQTRGDELIQWMRTQPNLDHLFLAVLSGSVRGDERQAVLNLGANAYLLKPPTPETIRHLIDHYLAFARSRALPSQMTIAPP